MKALRFIIIPVIVLLVSSCTQNNGHIGPLFGSWHLEEMTCDGEDYAQPAGTDTFWSFQGSVLRVTLSEGMYEKLDFMGTWERQGDSLVLDFTHSSDSTAPGTDNYRAPYWMGFPANEVLYLDVTRLNGSEMNLMWTSEEGKVYTYKFKKTW